MSQPINDSYVSSLVERFTGNLWRLIANLVSRDSLSTAKGQGLALLFAICLIASVDFAMGLGNCIELNTYYYTYGTISQTLATAYGVLVAVSIYRMQALEGEIEFAGSEVIEDTITDPAIKHILRRQNASHFWDQVEGYMDQTRIDTLSTDLLKSYVSSHRRFFFEGREDLRGMRQKLVEGLLYTSVTIFLSLILLTIGQLLRSSGQWPVFGPRTSFLLLSFMLILCARCLVFYYQVALTVTKRRPIDIYVSAGPLRPSHPTISGTGESMPPPN